jgi:hypothetical protein
LESQVELGHATSIYTVSMVNGQVEKRREGADGEERQLLQMTETVVGENRAQLPFSTPAFSLCTGIGPVTREPVRKTVLW